MSETKAQAAELTTIELKARLDRGDPITVLDVREDAERAFCAIPLPPTARDLHIPMGDVTTQLEHLRVAAGSDSLVVYCHHGVRSMSVAQWLARQGIGRVHSLAGGIDAWSESVDPSLPRY